jgi:hypothetical protein
VSVGDAAVIGSVWCRQVDPAAAVDRHRQVVLAEGDHATAEPADLPLPELAGLEVEADEDAESQDERSDLFAAFVVCRKPAYLIDRRHDGIDLSLRGGIDRCGWLGGSQLGDPTGRVCSFRHHGVERRGNRLVAVVVFFGGHPPLGRDDVGIKLGKAVAEMG